MLIPVILAGGSGTRLWPVSRQSLPKQFAAMGPGDTLFQATAKRLSGPGFAPPMVLTQSGFRFVVAQQLQEIGLQAGHILIEPCARNTAPAMLAAALLIARDNPDALMLVAPSDHAIRDLVGFQAAVQAGIPAAQAGRIVTFGVQPLRPETGYGYLELTQEAQPGAVVPLSRFVEKPDASRAASMVASGRYLWNAGIFLMRADTLIAAFGAHAADYLAPVRAALSGGLHDLDFLRLAGEPWAGLPDLSIDYAVMERAQNLSVVICGGDWSDLGDWNAVWREAGGGVVTEGAARAIDCEDTLLMSQDPGVEVIGLGLRNLIAVATPDAVLVADRDRAQDVRLAVADLRARGCRQADEQPVDRRPWGWFETLTLGGGFRVKRIHVDPGAALSLQSHMHRAEHWVVVDGHARVTVDDKTETLRAGQSVHVPRGALHRLENPARQPLTLIEVQTGAYLGEDDIIRYEDIYRRNPMASYSAGTGAHQGPRLREPDLPGRANGVEI